MRLSSHVFEGKVNELKAELEDCGWCMLDFLNSEVFPISVG